MRTKLGVFCDRSLEAGWLLAVIVTPLFFNVHSSRVFEPDKLSVLRSIALTMIALWLIKVIDGSGLDLSSSTHKAQGQEETHGPGVWQRLSGTPLVLPTLLLIGAYVLSTILSVAPRASLWGSYMRLQGTYTTFSYIVIFFLMLGTMRRREQVDRLCSTIILTSLPISLYGILQHYRLDSLPWSGDVTMRVAGNMGNAIFVAAYLIMAMPITLARLIESFSSLLKEEGTISEALLAGCYTFVLSVQAICTFFTQSRGPWLGLLGGLYVFVLVALISLRHSISDQSRINVQDVLRALAFAVLSIPVGVVPAYVVLVALKRGWRWLWLTWVMHTLLAAIFLVAINLPGTPLSSFRDLPYVGRLAQMFETEGGTGKVRVLIWEGTLDLITADPLRTIVGYGPETMHVAYNPFYPPDLAHYEARNASPDRSHNETLDALVITGVVGFAIYMFLFGSIFYYGLKWLGFMETKRQRDLFFGLSIGGAIAGTFVPKVIEGSYRLSGVGLPMGFIAGTSLYLMLSAALFYRSEQAAGEMKRQLLLIGLLSAIVAHFIEIHFGIAIAATRVHFWAYAAVFVLLGLNWIGEDVAAETERVAPRVAAEPRRRGKQSRRREKKQARLAASVAAQRSRQLRFSLTAKLLTGSLIVSLVLLTLGFDFIANPMGEIDALRIIQLSLTTFAPRRDYTTSYGVLWMFLLTWLVGALVVLAETERGASLRQALGWWVSSVGTYVAVTLTVFLFGAGMYASLNKPGVDIANTISFYYGSAAILWLLIGLSLAWDSRLPQRLWRTANLWAYPILMVLVGLAVFTTNISVVKADIYYKQGLRLEQLGRWDTSIYYYNRAISLAQDQDYYYLFLGRAMMGKASSVTDSEERVRWFEESFKALDRARQLNPLNTDHYANLGRLHRNWAEWTSDEEERAEKLNLAYDYYAQAAEHSPNNAQIWNEWSLVHLARGDYGGAFEKLEHSLSLDEEFPSTYILLGQLYSMQGKFDEAETAHRQVLVYEPEDAEAHSALGYIYYQRGNITDALAANLEAVRLDPGLARAHSTLGLIYFDQGRLEEAIAENLAVLQILPDDLISHRNLALLYQDVGHTDEAIAHAQRTLELSPEADRPGLQAYIDQLEAQRQP